MIVNQKVYLKPDFRLASPVNEVGEPMLQVRNFILGVPLSGNANLTVLSADYNKVAEVRILPVPEIIY